MKRILVYGCGNMGGAIAKALARNTTDWQLSLFDLQQTQTVLALQKQNVPFYNDIQVAFQQSYDLVLLAVKPQQAKDILASLVPYAKQFKLLVSIMAGISFRTIEDFFPTKALIRAMPNTPCSLGNGVTGFYGNKQVNQEEYQLVDSIFQELGLSVKLNSEDQVNSITAIAGSGPAYIFYLAEMLEKGALKLGLPKEIAGTLAKQTVFGSANLLHQSEQDAARLRQNVTSAKGTTDAALTSLQENNVEQSFLTAFQKAYERAQELSNE